MTFWEFFSRMFPYYMLGAFTFYAVWNSKYRYLLAFKLKPFLKFCGFLAMISVYRYIMLRIEVMNGAINPALSTVKSLPLGVTLFVGWEDMAHAVPIVLLRRFLGNSKWLIPARLIVLAAVMLEFGLGHRYQGNLAAAILSLYILVSIRYGVKVGFGTVMACHVMYDLATLSVAKYALSGF